MLNFAKKNSANSSGFTFIEIVIYVAILGIILFLLTGFIFNGLNSSSKIQAWQDVNDSGRFVSNKMIETIQSAQSVN